MGRKPPVAHVLGGEASGALNAPTRVRASGGGQCPCARRPSVRSSPLPYSTAVAARALADSLDSISVFEATAVDGRPCARMVSLYALVRVPLVGTLDTPKSHEVRNDRTSCNLTENVARYAECGSTAGCNGGVEMGMVLRFPSRLRPC